ncbi:MAG: GtrA family protein [Rikenellaceae bacterium]
MVESGINRRVATLLTWIIDILYPARIGGSIISRTTFRYFVCGVGNYIVLDAVIYYIIYHYVVGVENVDLGWVVVSPHIASLTLVFPVTFLTGFWLNRYVAFNSTAPKIRFQIMRYALTVGGSILLSYVLLKLFVERVEIWATPAKVLSSIATALYSYAMARFYTFREKVRDEKR